MKRKIKVPVPKKPSHLALIYLFMGVVVASAVIVATFFMLGYRFSLSTYQVERQAVVQFSSFPTGASVWIDGQSVFLSTPNKALAYDGSHTITMKKDGYETWRRTINVQAGSLSWYNYALLIPTQLKVKSVAKYSELYSSLASPSKKTILLQEKADAPTFQLVNISDDNNVKNTSLTIPANSYSKSDDTSIKHSFQMVKWSGNSQYVLIKHTYGDSYEWLVMNVDNASYTKNISTTVGAVIDDVYFNGNDGNEFYVLTASTVRLVNLSEGTISKVLVNNVSSFVFSQSTNIVSYVGKSDDGTSQVVGIYNADDSSPVVIKKINDLTASLKIVTTTYSGKDYIIIAENERATILSGDFPTASNDTTKSLSALKTFNVSGNIDELSFSPDGEYIFVKSGKFFSSYDIPYNEVFYSEVDGTSSDFAIDWLCRGYLWTVRDDKLIVRGFDGSNAHEINSAISSQDVTLSTSGNYLYSFNKTSDGIQLQRVKMIVD